ncbi:nucleotidyltransferase domain-containing protein [Rhodococcus erythropolis]|uniref:nucleotidyltransferase domain-containing protein n=1 Tax=Rhodococcus erythropolis TaxID=1833 RepID=UPI0029490681|nr:nucleotidyltransferase domain-containing protein [Rhodococcus erythropolis]MDV6273437.1 nucleotidyltransferase domain-containing protein [Rhodococcus erythropolis]
MSARLKGRRRAVNALFVDVARWAGEHDGVKGVALVGSYAHGKERMASDVDLMILADNPDALADGDWFVQIGPDARFIRAETWGRVRERRFRLRSGLLVELNFATESWADVPLDEGTRRVLEDGHRILYDTGPLRAAASAVRTDR